MQPGDGPEQGATDSAGSTGSTEALLRELMADGSTRAPFWASLIRSADVAAMAEIGVYRGELAARLLASCPGLQRYHMVDPWRNLADWNKPLNTGDDAQASAMREALAATEEWAERRVVHRGTTTEVIGEIPDDSLDLVYIDGDHTLRGITIDLLSCWPKVRPGGWVVGDDFSPTIWQHDPSFEPTLVFPFAVYFAEAVGARIYALPRKQFVIRKVDAAGAFAFVDLTDTYPATDLGGQIQPR